MRLTGDFILIAKLLVNLVLDYFRWTQLIPMILGWAFAVVMILGIMLIVFQGSIDAFLESSEPVVERILGPAPESTNAEEATALHLTEDDIVPRILKVWGWLAFAGWILSIIREKMFGPRPPGRLGRKIRISGIAAGLFTAILLITYLLIGNFSGNTMFELMVPFVLLPLLLWGVSAYGLTISYVIDELQKLISKLGVDETGEAVHKTTV